MFENGQKVMLKTYDELAEQFGVGGEDDFYDIMTHLYLLKWTFI